MDGKFTDGLVPDHLKELWQSVEQGELERARFVEIEAELKARMAEEWASAMGSHSPRALLPCLAQEIADYKQTDDLASVEKRMRQGTALLRDEWLGNVETDNPEEVIRFYDASDTYIYELMWWHTLQEDESPLAYVNALHLARAHHCHSHLDFGAGVGSGSILFAQNGFETDAADISATMLDFSRWRLEMRNIPADFIDLKSGPLPDEKYDFVTSMDVFEHVLDPAAEVDKLNAAIKPGGILFGRFHSDIDPERPQHIVQDFTPAFNRLAHHGFAEVWKDEWLYGHQAFQKHA